MRGIGGRSSSPAQAALRSSRCQRCCWGETRLPVGSAIISAEDHGTYGLAYVLDCALGCDHGPAAGVLRWQDAHAWCAVGDSLASHARQLQHLCSIGNMQPQAMTDEIKHSVQHGRFNASLVTRQSLRRALRSI